MLFTTNILLQIHKFTESFVQHSRPLVATGLKLIGSALCSRGPNVTPESELCSRICPLTQLHVTPALVSNRSNAKRCIFKQYTLQRCTLNTHTGATQFSAVLQASNGSSITHFHATANGSQEPTGT